MPDDTLGNRAAKLFLEGRWDEAKTIWDELTTTHPEDTDAKANYAIALLKQGKANSDVMEEYFAKAIALCPRDKSMYVSAAKGHYNSGQYSKAADHFLLANEYLDDPGNEPTLDSARALNKEWIGSCYDKLGDYEKAAKFWSECLQERDCWDPRSRAGIEGDLARVRRPLES